MATYKILAPSNKLLSYFTQLLYGNLNTYNLRFDMEDKRLKCDNWISIHLPCESGNYSFSVQVTSKPIIRLIQLLPILGDQPVVLYLDYYHITIQEIIL